MSEHFPRAEAENIFISNAGFFLLRYDHGRYIRMFTTILDNLLPAHNHKGSGKSIGSSSIGGTRPGREFSINRFRGAWVYYVAALLQT